MEHFFCLLVAYLKVWMSLFEISSKLDLQVTEFVTEMNGYTRYPGAE